MKLLTEYLSTKIVQSKIKATDDNIRRIVKDEIDRLGIDADLNHIDVSEVINMNSVFSCHNDDLGLKYTFLNPDISGWDVSKVKNMHAMFYRCRNFNCDINNWDVSNVKDMSAMFGECKSFNQDLSRWDVKNVENMRGMFCECKSFNQDLSSWNVSSVTYHHDNMFFNCPIKEEYKPKFNI